MKYKEDTGKEPDVDKWRKNKVEEELVNESDFLAKNWINYKSDQIVMGKKPVLLDWLKTEVKKYKKRYPLTADYMGGKFKKKTKYKRTNKRTNKQQKKYKKKSLKKRI